LPGAQGLHLSRGGGTRRALPAPDARRVRRARRPFAPVPPRVRTAALARSFGAARGRGAAAHAGGERLDRAGRAPSSRAVELAPPPVAREEEEARTYGAGRVAGPGRVPRGEPDVTFEPKDRKIEPI